MVVQLFSRSIESQLGRCKERKSYSSSRIGRGFFCASFFLHTTKLSMNLVSPLRACPCTLKQLPVSCTDMNWVRELYNSKFETLLWGWGCAAGLTSYPAPQPFAKQRVMLVLWWDTLPWCSGFTHPQLQECSALLALPCGASVPKARQKACRFNPSRTEWVHNLSTRCTFGHHRTSIHRIGQVGRGRPSCMAASSPRKWSQGGHQLPLRGERATSDSLWSRQEIQVFMAFSIVFEYDL